MHHGPEAGGSATIGPGRASLSSLDGRLQAELLNVEEFATLLGPRLAAAASPTPGPSYGTPTPGRRSVRPDHVEFVDPETGGVQSTALRDFTNANPGLVISADDERVAISDLTENTIRVFDRQTGQQIGSSRTYGRWRAVERGPRLLRHPQRFFRGTLEVVE
jgi:hypothetical protein